MTPERVREAVGALMALASTAAVVYLAVLASSEPALGALVAISAASVGYYLRGRVQAPDQKRSEPPQGPL